LGGEPVSKVPLECCLKGKHRAQNEKHDTCCKAKNLQFSKGISLITRNLHFCILTVCFENCKRENQKLQKLIGDVETYLQ